MAINGFLLIWSVIIRGIETCTTAVPEWVAKTTSILNSNKVGQVFLTRHLIERVRDSALEGSRPNWLWLVCLQEPFHGESSDDGANLVESQTGEKIPKPASPWQTFGKILDRVLFTTLTLGYLIMFFSLLPEGYFSATPEKEVEIVGYWNRWLWK